MFMFARIVGLSSVIKISLLNQLFLFAFQPTDQDILSVSSLHDIYASNFDLRPNSRIPRQVALPGVGDTIPRVFNPSILRLGYGAEEPAREDEMENVSQSRSDQDIIRQSRRISQRELNLSLAALRRHVQETQLVENGERSAVDATSVVGESRTQTVGQGASSLPSTEQETNTNQEAQTNQGAHSPNTDSPPENATSEVSSGDQTVQPQGTNTTERESQNRPHNQRRRRRHRRCVAGMNTSGTSHSSPCHCPACSGHRRANRPAPPPWYMPHPLPNEPPPPYRPHILPPYMADDNVPEYNSRTASPETLCVRL